MSTDLNCNKNKQYFNDYVKVLRVQKKILWFGNSHS